MQSNMSPPAQTRRRSATRVSLMQRYAWLYAALFFVVVSLGYLPGLTNPDGQLFGQFRIELKDDLLHLGSGLWAAIAAWRSRWASTLYFKLFGTVYLLDGIVGLLFGQAFLDGGIFIYGPAQLDLATRIGANIPHILIGGIAVLIGFVVSRRELA
jgi:hypothetical protein